MGTNADPILLLNCHLDRKFLEYFIGYVFFVSLFNNMFFVSLFYDIRAGVVLVV